MYNDPIDVGTSEDLQLTSLAKEHLASIGKWTQFFAILGFIACGLFVIGIIIGLVMGATASSGLGGDFAAFGFLGTGVVTILRFLILGLYVYISLCLYKYSDNIKIALRRDDSEALTEAFKNLKNFYLTIGILTIIFLVLFFLLFLFGLSMAGASRF